MADNTMILELPEPSTYGAVELKEIIKKYTLRGFLYMMAFIALLLIGYVVFNKVTEKSDVKRLAPPISKIQLTAPPPDATEQQQTVEPMTQEIDIATIAKAGNPVPVPDAEVTELKDFASFDQLSESLSKETGNIVDLNSMPSNYDFDKPKQVEVKQEEAIPDMDSFVSLEQEPDVDLVDLAKNTIYPEVARKAGIEGKVTVSVYIEKNGKVIKAVIRNSTSSMLNQAALDAVNRTTFKPGIQNKQPVRAWLLIPVQFKLK